MKDYSKIIKDAFGALTYLNDKGLPHKLNGPSIVFLKNDPMFPSCKDYYIDGYLYMYFDFINNNLYIHSNLLKIKNTLYFYIKRNIKKILKKHNPKIILDNSFFTLKRKLNKKYLKKLPDFIKDLIIL